MTHEEQTARMRKLSALMGHLNQVPDIMDVKGKQAINVIRAFAFGFMAADDKPDTIIYIALMRGGDPRPDIQSSIDNIVKEQNIQL